MGGDSDCISFQQFLMEMKTMLESESAIGDDDETVFWHDFTCDVGEKVPCPGSGQMCDGNMCCPGVPETRGLSFPCPSADSTFCTCASTAKLQDCARTHEIE